MLPVTEHVWWTESSLIPGFIKFEDWALGMGAVIYDFIKQLF